MDVISQQEWNKFSTMIAVDQLNLNEMQSYVDALGGTGGTFNFSSSNNLNNNSSVPYSLNNSSNIGSFNKQNVDRN